jgi:hypothetical protein
MICFSALLTGGCFQLWKGLEPTFHGRLTTSGTAAITCGRPATTFQCLHDHLLEASCPELVAEAPESVRGPSNSGLGNPRRWSNMPNNICLASMRPCDMHSRPDIRAQTFKIPLVLCWVGHPSAMGKRLHGKQTPGKDVKVILRVCVCVCPYPR